MIEVLLDVCGHYSSTYTFRNSEGRERERVAAQREFSERKFFQNNAVKSFFRDDEIWSLCLLFIEDHQGLWLTFGIEKIKEKRKLSGRPRHCGNKACHFSNFPFPTLDSFPFCEKLPIPLFNHINDKSNYLIIKNNYQIIYYHLFY